MNVETVKSEATSLIKNAAIFCGVILAFIFFILAIVFTVNHGKVIAGTIGGLGLLAADAVWTFLKSIPGWVWIVLAILRVGGHIERGLTAIAERLPIPEDKS